VKNKKLLIAATVALVLLLIYFAIPKNGAIRDSDKSSMIQVPAPKDFHGIAPEGTGGDADLNRMKNRWSAPVSFVPLTISEIISLPHDALSAMGKERRNRWSSQAIAEAGLQESKGVQVTGYIAKVKEEGPEACNGKSEIYHDFHIWITNESGQNKNSGIVVEAIPYWKEQFPSWQFIAFEKLAFEHTKVRVTGWLLWDQEHGDEVGKSRGSLWEVHPVTKFEYFSGEKWQELGNAPNQ
jgi:hypothetical protein